MRRDQVQQEPAFVLHRIPYRDTSQIVELFTRGHGRVSVVARGARRPKSPWRGLLQPFNEVLVSWTGRSDLRSLVAAEPAGQRMPLAGERLFSGFYMNELVLRLLQRHDPHDPLYHAYRKALAALVLDVQEGWALRQFERALLDEVGYGLNLVCDARSGEVIEPALTYRYVLQEGPVRQDGPGGGEGLVVRGSSLLALAGGGDCPDAEALRELRQLMRTVIDDLLGERPLKTRQVLGSMKR